MSPFKANKRFTTIGGNPMSTPVPEIWFKTQRVLRTIVQALVVLVPVVNGVALAAVDYLQSQTDVSIPPIVFLWLNIAIAGTALVMGLVARIMAVPGVNDALAHVGLGSVPKRALEGFVPGQSLRNDFN